MTSACATSNGKVVVHDLPLELTVLCIAAVVCGRLNSIVERQFTVGSRQAVQHYTAATRRRIRLRAHGANEWVVRGGEPLARGRARNGASRPQKPMIALLCRVVPCSALLCFDVPCYVFIGCALLGFDCFAKPMSKSASSCASHLNSFHICFALLFPLLCLALLRSASSCASHLRGFHL